MVADFAHHNAGQPQGADGQAEEASCGSIPGGSSGRSRTGSDAPDPGKLAQDWITLWQSELSALAVDPEVRDAWQTMASLWTGAITAIVHAMPREATQNRHRPAYDSQHDRSGGCAGPAEAPRSPPAAAAPDARDAEIDRLARRVAALEQRLAKLERGGGTSIHQKRHPRRKS